jgi:hypothetical protein
VFSLNIFLYEDPLRLKSNEAIRNKYKEIVIKRLKSLSTSTRFDDKGTALHIRKENIKTKTDHILTFLSADKNFKSLIRGKPMLISLFIL